MDIDRQSLESEFEMDALNNDVSNLVPINTNDPEEIIKLNIERADRILNILEDELNAGNITARMMEVASTLINSVTMSSKELITSRNYEKYLQIREKMVQYKYDELEVKKNKKEAPANQNLIIASREDILRVIGKSNNQPKVIEIEN